MQHPTSDEYKASYTFIVTGEYPARQSTLSQSEWVSKRPRKVPGPNSAEMQPWKRGRFVHQVFLCLAQGAETRVEPL